MIKYLTNNYNIIDLHKKPTSKSEVVTQMIYGESFSILKKSRKWLKIKIKEDGYNGFIKNKKFLNYITPTHKIGSLKANVYKFPNFNKKTFEISFGSKIKILDKKRNSIKFHKGWINKKHIKLLSFKEKNVFKKILLFKNVKYKWGGKSFKGIDCSGLIQLFLNFNNLFCPRDAKDQVKYFKKNIKFKNIKKNDIIFWKGHVAVVLSKKKLIHAYGPMKKTVVMDISKTIERIKKTAKLKVISIKRTIV